MHIFINWFNGFLNHQEHLVRSLSRRHLLSPQFRGGTKGFFCHKCWVCDNDNVEHDSPLMGLNEVNEQ